MTFLPMLAKNAAPRDVPSYINDDKWWAQQKLDGIRILITIDEGVISGTGRSGRAVEFDPADLLPFSPLTKGLWRFDGEFVDDTLWLFDMPNGGKVTPNSPYDDRYVALGVACNIMGLDDTGDIRLVSASRTPAEKKALIEWCRANDSEGVMFKNKTAPYLAGSRSYDNLKHKFTETIDVVILEVGREGKDSCAVGAFHNGTLTDIGSVKLTSSQGLGHAQPGDVIEVRYLNAGKGSIPRLYQPVFLKFRPDRTPESCSTDQLKFLNKKVKDAR